MVWVVPSVNSAIRRARLTANALRDGSGVRQCPAGQAEDVPVTVVRAIVRAAEDRPAVVVSGRLGVARTDEHLDQRAADRGVDGVAVLLREVHRVEEHALFREREDLPERAPVVRERDGVPVPEIRFDGGNVPFTLS